MTFECPKLIGNYLTENYLAIYFVVDCLFVVDMSFFPLVLIFLELHFLPKLLRIRKCKVEVNSVQFYLNVIKNSGSCYLNQESQIRSKISLWILIQQILHLFGKSCFSGIKLNGVLHLLISFFFQKEQFKVRLG